LVGHLAFQPLLAAQQGAAAPGICQLRDASELHLGIDRRNTFVSKPRRILQLTHATHPLA
jgi:hypothetical protein